MAQAFQTDAFQNDAFEVSGASSVSLALAATEGADVAASTLALAMALAMAATEGADNAAATASLALSLSMAAVDGADTAAGSVAAVVSAGLAATEGADVLASTLDVVAAGSVDMALAATEGADTFAATQVDEGGDNQPGGFRIWNLKRRKRKPRVPLILDVDSNFEDEPAELTAEPAEALPAVAAGPVTPPRNAAPATKWVPAPPIATVRAALPKPARAAVPLRSMAELAEDERKTKQRHHALRLLLLAS